MLSDELPRVRIVTDSAADIPPEIAKALHIVVVPLSIHFGDTVYLDGVDIDAARFYTLMRERPEFPRTSQPSVGRFEEAYQSLYQQHAEIVSIHLSSKWSGTLSGATMAAKSVPGASIHLVDSMYASMAQGLLVIEAARMAAEGRTAVDIVRTVESMRSRGHVSLMINDLAHVQRGGRIGRAQGLLGTLLSVKPIVGIEDGALVPRQRARTAARALQIMAEEVRSRLPVDHIQVLHSNAFTLLDEFQHLLEPIMQRAVPSGLLGPVAGTHSGEGAIGVVVIRAEER